MNQLQKLYDKGVNIMEFFRGDTKKNNLNAILYSYDLQSGSYTERYIKDITSNNTNTVLLNGKTVEMTGKEYYERLNKYFAGIIDSLNVKNLIEAGVGEATALSNIVKNIKTKPDFAGGFDISLSRIMYASKFAKDNGSDLSLFTGNLFNMPFADNSIDCVLTVHAIEPNTGREEEALKELYRVAARYVVMFEPDYELGNDATKANIEKHCYIKNLAGTAKKLGMNIIEHKLCDIMGVTNNRSVIIISKTPPPAYQISKFEDAIACPSCHNKLMPHKANLYCKECGLIYPVIEGLPVLIKENAILCSKYLEF